MLLDPDGYRGEVIRLTLSAKTGSPRAFSSVIVDVDFSGCLPNGIVLPLEVTVTAPSPAGFVRHYYRRAAPQSIIFRPSEGGRHLVRIAEAAHQKFYGVITIDVAGDYNDPRRLL
jgi:hypothetical protein